MRVFRVALFLLLLPICLIGLLSAAAQGRENGLLLFAAVALVLDVIGLRVTVPDKPATSGINQGQLGAAREYYLQNAAQMGLMADDGRSGLRIPTMAPVYSDLMAPTATI